MKHFLNRPYRSLKDRFYVERISTGQYMLGFCSKSEGTCDVFTCTPISKEAFEILKAEAKKNLTRWELQSEAGNRMYLPEPKP